MYNPDTDLLFPPRTIITLRDLRGEVWQDLVNKVIEAGSDSLDQMAFVLMMAHMNNCATCTADSYRAMTGCTACTKQSIKRSHETDEGLAKLYQAAMEELQQYIQNKTNPSRH